MANFASESTTRRHSDLVELGRNGVSIAILVAVVNVTTVLVASAVVALPTDIPALQLPQVAIASAVPAIVATIVYEVLRRYTTRPKRNLLIVSALVLTLSFVGYTNFEPGATGTPGAIPADPTLLLNTLIVLSVMHVVTATLIVGGLFWSTTRASKP